MHMVHIGPISCNMLNLMHDVWCICDVNISQVVYLATLDIEDDISYIHLKIVRQAHATLHSTCSYSLEDGQDP